MKILVHDYAGHPYAVQLSRALARRGHDVLHVYSSSNPMPQGTLARGAGDPVSFNSKAISLGEKIDKANFVKRRGQEIEHGRKAAAAIAEFKPDVVLSGSTPLDPQNHIWQVCRSLGIPRVFWLQDITGVATKEVLKKKLPFLGAGIGVYYTNLERSLLRDSEAVVAISSDFIDLLAREGVPREKLHLVENWGPLDEIPATPRSNPWAERHGLVDTFNFIYSGTLGMKHNPQLLVRLASAFAENSDVRVVVVTEGIGRRYLEARKSEAGLGNLVLLDFQPFSEVPLMMGAADVLTAVLEPSAGIFSVPSKVLAYLCARRSLLLAVPTENLASRIVVENEAGLVGDPMDEEAFAENARRLYEDAELRERLAANGRAYAEKTFDIERICDRFIEIFTRVARS